MAVWRCALALYSFIHVVDASPSPPPPPRSGARSVGRYPPDRPTEIGGPDLWGTDSGCGVWEQSGRAARPSVVNTVQSLHTHTRT